MEKMRVCNLGFKAVVERYCVGWTMKVGSASVCLSVSL